MGIGSWWKKVRGREDAEALERAEERTHETPEERKLSTESIDEFKADRFVARSEHEPNIEDADRLGEADD
jgi:hypothetical protein